MLAQDTVSSASLPEHHREREPEAGQEHDAMPFPTPGNPMDPNETVFVYIICDYVFM